MWHCDEGMGWWMVFGGIWIVVFWGLIIGVAVWGIKKITGRRDSNWDDIKNSNALDMAKERYARGEISRQEYEQIKKDIS